MGKKHSMKVFPWLQSCTHGVQGYQSRVQGYGTKDLCYKGHRAASLRVQSSRSSRSWAGECLCRVAAEPRGRGPRLLLQLHQCSVLQGGGTLEGCLLPQSREHLLVLHEGSVRLSALSVSESVGQSVGQSISQSVSQSVGRPVGRLVGRWA